ncbi:MAG: purine-binding chemotaxis protein CheW [bacterium]|nr:purine-binding chemotaxis protein CheW [bacterium]
MQTDLAVADPQDALADLAGKFLTFSLGDEVYGVEIQKVQEIIGIMPVTQIPKTPAHVRGVVNLRGKVIPVVDLRLKFGLEAREDTDRTCIVVTQVACHGTVSIIGVIVDEVSEVLDIVSDQIEPPPSFGASVDTDFILGMGKLTDKVVMLLGIEAILGNGALASLAGSANEQA